MMKSCYEQNLKFAKNPSRTEKQLKEKTVKRNKLVIYAKTIIAHKKVHCITISFALNLLRTIAEKEVYELAYKFPCLCFVQT